MIYVAVIFFSAFCAFLAGRCAGPLSWVLNTAVLLPFVCVAALRDFSIGTDVFAYAYWECRYAAGNGFLDYVSASMGAQNIGFTLLAWMTCSFAHLPLAWLLGFTQLLTIVPILWTLNRISPRYAWMGVLAYGFLLFPFSLNGMKQSIAIAVVCASCVPLIARKTRHFLLGILLATSFHQTALVALLLFPLYHELVPAPSTRPFFGKERLPGLIGCVAVAVLVAWGYGAPIVRFLSGFKASYSYQVDRLGTGDWNLSFAALGLVCLALLVLHRSATRPTHLINEKGEVIARDSSTLQSFILCAGLFGALLAQLDVLSPSLGRLGWYGVAPLVLLPQISTIQDKRLTTAFALGLALIGFFYGRTVLFGLDQVYPYRFAL